MSTTRGLRTGGELQRVLEQYVLPHWHDRVFVEIKRSDIARCSTLSKTSMAIGRPTVCCRCCVRVELVRHARRQLRAAICQKHAAHPAAGPQTQPHADRRRIAQSMADGRDRLATFMALSCRCRCCAASAAQKIRHHALGRHCGRRHMDNTHSAAREGQPRRARLPPMALDIIRKQPRLAGNPYVFAGRSNGPLSGFSSRHESSRRAAA